jgi:replicative DNA helicase
MELSNTATEKAILGCILFDNSVLEELGIKQSLFYDPLNAEIWRQIEMARARGSRADLVELCLRLPDKASYIACLTDCATFGNEKAYFSDLLRLYKLRRIVGISRGISNLVADENTPDKITEYIEAELTSLSESEEEGYRHVSSVIPKMVTEIEKAHALKGALPGVPTGFPTLDSMTNGWQPEYWVIGARPSTGKTALALVCATAALCAGKKVGLFSAEMSDTSLIKRIMANLANVDHSRIRSGFLSATDLDVICEESGKLSDLGLYINDKPNIRKAELLSEARKLKRKEKVDIIFIDYIGLITSDDKSLPRHEQIADISRSMKGLSRELNIPIIALSQVTRDAEGKRPTMANIRESGAIEQDADGIAFLWDQGNVDDAGEIKKITFILAKQRNGPTGDISLAFTRSKMRFKEVDKPWK